MKPKQLSLFAEDKDTRKVKEKKKRNLLLGPKSLPVGYNKYIKSNEGKEKRKFAFKAVNYQWTRCGKKDKLQVHHLNYRYLYKERLNDVRVLCERCHKDADVEGEYDTAFDIIALRNTEKIGCFIMMSKVLKMNLMNGFGKKKMNTGK